MEKNISLILHIESNFLTESCAKFQLKTLANFSQLLDGCILTSLLSWPYGSIRFYSHPSSIIIHFPFVYCLKYCWVSNYPVKQRCNGSLEPGAFIAASLFRCCLVQTPSFCISFYKFISNQKLEEKGRKLDSRRFGYSRSRCSLYCRGGHYAFGNLEMAALCSTSFVFV